MDNKEVVNRGIEIYKERKLKYQVTDYLKSLGYDEKQSSELLTQIVTNYNQQRKQYLKKCNVFLFLGSILLFILVAYIFYFLLPNTSMRNSPFITSVLGAGVLMLIAYHIIALYDTWSDNYLDSLLKNNSHIQINYSFLFIMALPAIVPYFILNSKYKEEIEMQILQNGIEVEGKILNGWSEEIRNRRGRIEEFYVEVEFRDENGKKILVNKEVGKREFSNFYKGQKVKVIYDKNRPENIEILNDATSIRKFTNVEERGITGKDLFNFLEINNVDSIYNKLNSISMGWSNKQDRFVNERRFEMVEAKDSVIAYTVQGRLFDNAIKQFDNDDFQLIEEKRSQYAISPSKTNLYQSAKYMVQVEQKAVLDEESRNSHVFTTILVMKK